MNVLITGGSGFIGKALINAIDPDVGIICIDSLDPQVHAKEREFSAAIKERAQCVKADIRDVDKYISYISTADIVVHLASQTGTGQSQYERAHYVGHNVEGTAALLDAMYKYGQNISKIVLSSSRAVYGEGSILSSRNGVVQGKREIGDLEKGNWEPKGIDGSPGTVVRMSEGHECRPTSIYGYTKHWQEILFHKYAQETGANISIFRIQNAYGPGQDVHNPYTGIIGLFASQIIRGEEVELFEDGRMIRDFVFVEDVANIINYSIKSAALSPSILNIGTGDGVSLISLVNIISSLLNKELIVNISGRFRLGDVRYAVADTSNLKEWYGPCSLTNINDGLQRYLKWFVLQEPLSKDRIADSLKELEYSGMLRVAR